MERVILDSGKAAYAADAYQPDGFMSAQFVGRHREMRMVTAAWMSSGFMPPLSPLLIGEPGLGKNRLVYELSRQSGLPLYIFQGHEDVTAEDLACAVRFSDDSLNRMDYVLSPLVAAMLSGGICFIDEIGKIRPRALALLVSVLDERRYIDSTLLGERVYAKPGFRMVGATNSGEINALPEFIQSRMRPVIEIGHPPREEIDEILTRHLHGDHEAERVLEAFWSIWLKSDRRPTPREALHHIALASSLSDYEKGSAKDGSNRGCQGQVDDSEQNGHGLSMKPEHLEEAFKQLVPEKAQ